MEAGLIGYIATEEKLQNLHVHGAARSQLALVSLLAVATILGLCRRGGTGRAPGGGARLVLATNTKGTREDFCYHLTSVLYTSLIFCGTFRENLRKARNYITVVENDS